MPLDKVILLAVTLTIKSAAVSVVVRVFLTHLDAPAYSVSRLSLRNARTPGMRRSLVIAPRENDIKNEMGEFPSQCSMMWATISKATIPSVARDAASTKKVRRFSSVVIIARWKPTLASILSLRACQRV